MRRKFMLFPLQLQAIVQFFLGQISMSANIINFAPVVTMARVELKGFPIEQLATPRGLMAWPWIVNVVTPLYRTNQNLRLDCSTESLLADRSIPFASHEAHNTHQEHGWCQHLRQSFQWGISIKTFSCLSVLCFSDDFFTELVQHYLLNSDRQEWFNAGLAIVEQVT